MKTYFFACTHTHSLRYVSWIILSESATWCWFFSTDSRSHNTCLAGAYKSAESIVILATHHAEKAEIFSATINVLWLSYRITYPLLGQFNPCNLYRAATSLQDNIPRYSYWLGWCMYICHVSEVIGQNCKWKTKPVFIFITEITDISLLLALLHVRVRKYGEPPLQAGSVSSSFLGSVFR